MSCWKAMTAACMRKYFKNLKLVQVLEDLQTDPKTQQQHLAHPQIRANIDKLVSAGIVQMR